MWTTNSQGPTKKALNTVIQQHVPVTLEPCFLRHPVFASRCRISYVVNVQDRGADSKTRCIELQKDLEQSYKQREGK